jgi:hypothetical protein
MAPEQALGGEIDARTDVYGVAATMLHALTSLTPPRPPIQKTSELAPYIPRALAEVLDRALAVNPLQRWATAKAMLEALAPFLSSDTPATPFADTIEAPPTTAAVTDIDPVAPPIDAPPVADATVAQPKHAEAKNAATARSELSDVIQPTLPSRTASSPPKRSRRSLVRIAIALALLVVLGAGGAEIWRRMHKPRLQLHEYSFRPFRPGEAFDFTWAFKQLANPAFGQCLDSPFFDPVTDREGLWTLDYDPNGTVYDVTYDPWKKKTGDRNPQMQACAKAAWMGTKLGVASRPGAGSFMFVHNVSNPDAR